MNKNKLEGIQAWRGIACVMVFLSHFYGEFIHPITIKSVIINNTPLRLLSGGNAAVIVFFFLSGFFVYKENCDLNAKRYCNLVFKRIKRLYPLFFITLSIGLLGRFFCPQYDASLLSAWANTFWDDKITLKEIIRHYTMIFPGDTHKINPVIWTMVIEGRMTFILPIFALMFKKCNKIKYEILIILASCILAVKVLAIRFLPVFVFGIFAKKHMEWIRQKFNVKFRIFLFVLGIIMWDTEYLFKFMGITIPDFLRIILTGIGVFLVSILCAEPSVKFKSDFMKFWVWIGNHSYAFYLIHFIVLLFFRFAVAYVGLWVYGVVCFIISLLFAYSLDYLNKIINRKMDRRKHDACLMDN